LTDWVIKFHPDLLKDLDRLDLRVLQLFYSKKDKIRSDPLRFKHLRGGENCYREEITSNIRLIYYIEGKTIWLLTIGRHDAAYRKYLNRLHSLRHKHFK